MSDLTNIPPQIIQVNEGTQLRIQIEDFRNKTYLDIRQFWKPEDEWVGTGKGIKIEMGKYQEFRDAFMALDAQVYEALVVKS